MTDYDEMLTAHQAYLFIGHAGPIIRWLNKYGGVSSCSGIAYSKTAELKARAVELGIPVIDAEFIPPDILFKLTIIGPMVAIGTEPDQPPYNALSYAPIAYVAETYRLAGADVRNI